MILEDFSMWSAGDLTFYRDQLYLSPTLNGLSIILINPSGGGFVSPIHKIDSLVDVFGMFTEFKGCKEDFYVTTMNDIYMLDDNLEPQLHCEDIVEEVINGAASNTETFADFSNVLEDEMILCENQVPLEIKVDKPFANYQWNDGSTINPQYIYSAGTYWVDITLAECTKRDSIEVILQSIPTVDLGEDLVLCEGTKHIVEIPIEGVDFKWQDGSWRSTLTVTESGTYQVEISKDGCKDTDQVNIDFEYCAPILELPNVITPNSDGYNDKLVPIKTENIKSIYTSIFNRFGKKLFETDNPSIEWSPIDLPSGLYYYFIKYTELTGLQFNKKGWVQVLK